MRKTKEEAAITRENLLSAALKVFSKDGYMGARLEDIAEIANVSKGAIFHHFGSKANLYNELLIKASERGGQLLAELQSESHSACDNLRNLLIAPILIADRDPEFRATQELMYFKTATPPELEEGMRQKRESIRSFLDEVTKIVQAGIEAKEIRSDIDPYDVAVSLHAQQNGLLILFLLDPETISVKKQIDRIADTFMRGIRAG